MIHIKAIFLSEFNERAGLRMIHCQQQKKQKNMNRNQEQQQLTQAQQIINSQQFSLCSDLVLPRQQFCNRMLAIQYRQDYFIVGMPQLSVNTTQDKTYKRAKYIYSINIIVQKKLYIAGQQLYKQIARKLAFFFRALQQAYHLIYNNDKSINYLKNNLQHIIYNINKNQQCNLTHMSHHYTFINFKQSPFQQPQNSLLFHKNNQNTSNNQNTHLSSQNNRSYIKSYTVITPYTVPITNLTKQQVDNINSQLGRVLMEYAYKGDFIMKKIYNLHSEKYKQEQINKFYQKGIKLGIVFMVDLFDIQNCYSLTPQILKYTRGQIQYKQKFAEICKSMMFSHLQIATKEDEKNSSFLQPKQNINQQDILLLYFQIQRKIALKKIIQKNMKKFRQINVVKWIRLGQLLNIIVRVHQKIFYTPVSDYLYENTKQKDTGQKQNQSQYISKKAIKQFCPTFYWDSDSDIYDMGIQKKLNEIFKEKLRNMTTLQEMCIQMKIDRNVLLNLCKQQKKCIIQVTSQKH